MLMYWANRWWIAFGYGGDAVRAIGKDAPIVLKSKLTAKLWGVVYVEAKQGDTV